MPSGGDGGGGPTSHGDGDDDLDVPGDNDPADNGGRSPDPWWRRLVDRLLACLGRVGRTRGMERLLKWVYNQMFRYKVESLRLCAEQEQQY